MNNKLKTTTAIATVSAILLGALSSRDSGNKDCFNGNVTDVMHKATTGEGRIRYDSVEFELGASIVNYQTFHMRYELYRTDRDMYVPLFDDILKSIDIAISEVNRQYPTFFPKSLKVEIESVRPICRVTNTSSKELGLSFRVFNEDRVFDIRLIVQPDLEHSHLEILSDDHRGGFYNFDVSELIDVDSLWNKIHIFTLPEA